MDETILALLVLLWIVIAFFVGGTFATRYVMGGHNRVPFTSYVLGTIGAPITILLAIIKGLFGHEAAQRSLGFVDSRLSTFGVTMKSLSASLFRSIDGFFFVRPLTADERDRIRRFEAEGVKLLVSLSPDYVDDVDMEDTNEQKQWRKELEELRLGRQHIAANSSPQELGEALATTDARIAELQGKLPDRTLPKGKHTLNKHGLRGISPETCEEAIARQPDNPFLPASYCNTLVMGAFHAKLSHSQSSIELMPRYPYAHFLRGKCLLEHAGYRLRGAKFEAWLTRMKGLHALRHAITLDPKYIRAYAELAKGYNDQGQHRSAIKAAESALAIDAKHENAYYDCGPKNGTSIVSDRAEAAYQLGVAHHKLDHYEQARNAYTTVLASEDARLHSLARSNRLEVLLKLGNKALALADIKQKVTEGRANLKDYNVLIELEPNNPEHYAGRSYFGSTADEQLADKLHAAKLYQKIAKPRFTEDQYVTLVNALASPLYDDELRSGGSEERIFELLPSTIQIARDANCSVQTFPEVLLDSLKFAVDRGLLGVAVQWAEQNEPHLPQPDEDNYVDDDVPKIYCFLVRVYATKNSHFDLSKARGYAITACDFVSSIEARPLLWAIAEAMEPGAGKDAVAPYVHSDEEYADIERDGKEEMRKLRLATVA